jgi:hypothetical protein
MSNYATLATAGGRQFAAGNPGQIADQEEAQIATHINQNSAAIDFGVAVARDTTVDAGCKPWSGDSDYFLGVSVRNPHAPAASDGYTVNFAQYSEVPVLKDGVIFVQAAEAVRAGDQVLIITAGGAGNGTAGAFGGSKGGVAGSGRVAIPGMNGIWIDTVASGGIGRIRIKTTGTARTTT